MAPVGSMLRKPEKGKVNASDLSTGSPVEVGRGIAECLKVKGYCVIARAIKDELLDEAREDVRTLASAGKMKQPSRMIQDALLGSEGSNTIYELPFEKLGSEGQEPLVGAGIDKVDKVLWALAKFMRPFQHEVGLAFEVSSRSRGVLHVSDSLGEAREDDPVDEELASWMSVLLRQKVAVYCFLGPAGGTVDLRPFDEEALEMEIAVSPGLILLIRTDLLSYHFRPQGHDASFAVGCSFLQDSVLSLQGEALQQHVSPCAQQLVEFAEGRLARLKEEQDPAALQVPSIPRRLASVMNHNFVDRSQAAVRGFCSRQPSTWDEADFFCALSRGPDLVAEVPIARWDHSRWYDTDPEGWKQNKTTCRHAAFMEGVELFDSKFFGLAPGEVSVMEPNQRQVLEVCYEALHRGGMKRRDIMGSVGGVYVGVASTNLVGGGSDWKNDRPAEWGVFGATGASPAITAGRISFTLGLKGMCVAIDTDAASTLTCTINACESVSRKGYGQVHPFACVLGVHTVLAGTMFPAHTAAGFLSALGRCSSFDSSADGWVRAESASGMVVRPHVEGSSSADPPFDPYSVPLDGIVAGGAMNSNGVSASLSAPSGPSEQEMIWQMTRVAGISPLDIEAIECHGCGRILHDAVEAISCQQALRQEGRDCSEEPLLFSCVKSNLGNGIEASGLTALIKVLQSFKWRTMTPSLHLRQLNPYVSVDHCPQLPSECLGYRFSSAYVGTTAKSLGGTNVGVLCFGATDEEMRPPREEHGKDMRPRFVFWPGGGGASTHSSRPKRGFSIVGTFNRWSGAEPMQDDADGCFSYIMTLGENRWEAFQILLEGDPNQVLHPRQYAAPKGSGVHGPSPPSEAKQSWWLLNARSEMYRVSDGGPVLEYNAADAGKAGDRFAIFLHVAGKYRAVTWRNMTAGDAMNAAVGDLAEPRVPESPVPSTADYYVTASWNEWSLTKMQRARCAGNFQLEVLFDCPGGEFRIVRNKDPHQVIFPIGARQPASACIVGPQDPMKHASWFLEAQPGSRHVIMFRRERVAGADEMRVSWSACPRV